MNGNILLLALVFGLSQSAYFGWNMTPQSDAELICDGITLLIGALALLPKVRGRV